MKKKLHNNIQTIVVGPLCTNCYVVWDEMTRESVIIDPGADASKIQRVVTQYSLTPVLIVNTHGHGDHIAANDAFHVPVAIHKDDACCLTNPEDNLSSWYGLPLSVTAAQQYVEEGHIITIGSGVKMRVLHTPGHSPGGICLLYETVLFSGDTLFFEGVGRTDIPRAHYKDLERSLREKLFLLPEDTIVYPGHGPSTTIGHEKQ